MSYQLTSAKVSFLEISASHAGQRVDNFLMARLKGVPKSRIYRIIRKGEVRVNKKRVKAEYKLRQGDTLRIPPVTIQARGVLPPPSESLCKVLEDAVIYEDEALLVINKPAGLSVHAGTGVKQGLIEALRYLRKDCELLELVHRIDKSTSGCILIAKRRHALNKLTRAFRDKQVTKVYHLLVHGTWPANLRRVEAALEKKPAHGGERKVIIHEEGMSARTDFSILETFPACTLLEARPLTGRTHQIRVHCCHSGHPIVGDQKYSSKTADQLFHQAGIKRMCLHAAELQIEHPDSGETLHLIAPGQRYFGVTAKTLGQL